MGVSCAGSGVRCMGLRRRWEGGTRSVAAAEMCGKCEYTLFCGHLGWGGSGERESVGGRGEDVLDDADANVDQRLFIICLLLLTKLTDVVSN